jgi:hypothetical protein
MKTSSITLILILIHAPVFAGITSVCIEPIAAQAAITNAAGVEVQAAVPAHYQCRAYGLLPDGQPKTIALIETTDQQQYTDVQNAPAFNLGRSTLRAWIYFDADGALSRVDFHLAAPFESKLWTRTQIEADTTNGPPALSAISALKTLIESK